MSHSLALLLLTGLACNASSAVTIFSDNFDANPVSERAAPSGWSTEGGGGTGLFGSNASGTLNDFLPGNGVYVYLNVTRYRVEEMSRTFSLSAYASYTAFFDLAGNQDAAGDPSGVLVRFGDAIGGAGLRPKDPFTTFSLNFTPAESGDYRLSFLNENMTGNTGALIDNVIVVATPVPEPGNYTLLLGGLSLMMAITRPFRKLPQRTT